MRNQKKLSQAAVPARRERGSSSLQGRLSIIIGAILAVCAVTIVTSGGTFALWNSQATVSAGTIQAGSVNLLINGSSSATVNLASAKLMPGTSVTSTYDVQYKGDSAATLTSKVSVVAGTNVNGLASSLIVTTRRIASGTTCASAGAGGALNPDPAQWVTLSSDTFTASPTTATVYTYCLDVKLDPNAPQTVQNGAVQFLVTYTATQS